MARIRTIKPEVRTDLTVAGWPREVRLAWVYLWNTLDDEGRFRDNLALLVAELFPLDEDVTTGVLDGWLDIMATSPGDSGVPPLCRYEVDGRRYLHATKWSHQAISKPSRSKLPACPEHPAPERSRRAPGTFREGSGRAPSAQATCGQEDSSREQGTGNREQESVRAGVRVIPTALAAAAATATGGPTDGPDLDRIARALRADTTWAGRVADDVLARARGGVADPTAYVLAAVEAEPARYRPTATAPRLARCEHGLPAGSCGPCIDAAAVTA